MIRIDDIRSKAPRILVQGLHPGIIQSMLDYDYLLERTVPSVVAVIAKGRKKERFFWGDSEIELPLYGSLADVPIATRRAVTAVMNVQSARGVQVSVVEAMTTLPHVQVVAIFAENTPEVHSLQLGKLAQEKGVLLVGPSSVGVLLPGTLKLGAIGGTTYEQLETADIETAGDVAVITTSGGMVNELIRVVTERGRGVSFAIAMGGDRFPALEPAAAILLAENDPQTKEIVYFGELGGGDEYKIVQLIKDGKVTKRVVAYIAGVVAELFATPPQFGHAKALAQHEDESANAKKRALQAVGVTVCERIDEIELALRPGTKAARPERKSLQRHQAYFMSHLSGEVDGNVQLLGRDLLATVQGNSVASLTLSVLLGYQVQSEQLIAFTDLVLKLLIDHSPNVSGAVNTMIAARAGKDLVSSLAAGLLTIGPRFGGAVNDAARAWRDGVSGGLTPKELVDRLTRSNGIVPGIGHKKYRLDSPDPRVQALMEFAVPGGQYLPFARSVEQITTMKKSNLILNVDGAIAAIMLDLLAGEGLTPAQLDELVSIEFFNALFVVSRAVGFTGHYLDQRRHDEGLFRLDDDDLRYFSE